MLLVSLALLAGAAAMVRRADSDEPSPPRDSAKPLAEVDRSPADVVLTPDEKLLLTANQTSGTISLVRFADGKVLAELPCGRKPAALALSPDGRRAYVSSNYSGELFTFDLDGESLKPAGRLHLGFEPRGLAISPDGSLAYVALSTAHEIAVVDLAKLESSARIKCGKWPRYLALSPDGKRLAVGANGDLGVTVIDTAARQALFTEEFAGINLGHMQVSRDGKHVYFPWMVYRHNPITAGNIRLGWVLASRIARVNLEKKSRREAIALDPQGQAIADPHGLALSPDEQWIACTGSGTHELLVFKLPGLPFQDYGGPGDHIDTELNKDRDRFYRIPLGGRPMAVRFMKDGRRVIIANYLSNSVQVVDLEKRSVERTIDLGGPKEPSLERRGEAIFYDGKRSLDQWYSCHSCHYEGHTNAVTMDTRNDGRFGNFKTVLSLRNLDQTGPYFWHGWQTDMTAALRKSLTETMLGPTPSDADVAALTAFIKTLRPPPNSHRRGPELSEAAKRGEKVFKSDKAACSRCHKGEYFTDGKIHDVGTGERSDVYKGYNPPSLLNVYDRVRYLHDGRVNSLEELLNGPHNPNKVVGNGELTKEELADLLAYLREI